MHSIHSLTTEVINYYIIWYSFSMNNKLPILIAATIGLCILTTNISINFAIAKRTHENGYGGYGGMRYGGYGGAGPVIQEPVDTGNHHLDKAINKFYNCLSHTHEDLPTIEKVDNCYYRTFLLSSSFRNIELTFFCFLVLCAVMTRPSLD